MDADADLLGQRPDHRFLRCRRLRGVPRGRLRVCDVKAAAGSSVADHSQKLRAGGNGQPSGGSATPSGGGNLVSGASGDRIDAMPAKPETYNPEVRRLRSAARRWSVKTTDATARRNLAILELHSAGDGYRDIGRLVGLSHVAVRKIVARGLADASANTTDAPGRGSE